ncbi:unnamed protein product [Choristocarpus tenellus]
MCRSDEPKFCKVFDGIGRRRRLLSEVEHEQWLYLVPQERIFAWPTVKVGQRVTVPHVKNPKGKNKLVWYVVLCCVCVYLSC